MADNASPTNRILVKLRPSTALRAAESRVGLRPLYENNTPASAMGMNAEPQWFLADIAGGAPTPWDLAHYRVADELGIAASDIIFAEPDLQQTMFVDDNRTPSGNAMAVADYQCNEVIDQDGDHGKVVGKGLAWHLGANYSQLGPARDKVSFTEPRTRIAHVDTGYFREHITTPARILRQLERNFVEGDANTQSAEDPDNKKFGMDNSGHGTGTISVLAGGTFENVILGGAYDADIVPIRVADRVALFHTSAIAQALNYATDIQCDVLTMSLGGLPSNAWSEAIDRAYMSGLCLVAAAGNNVHHSPKGIVYPARYPRVIAVCGAMANGKPYDGLDAMQGNYGPDSQMDTAIATYTPNIPWAVYGCKDKVRLNGEGTSAATPQIAAAAALWIEKYKSTLPRDWRRVEAVRNALFSTANKSANQKSKLGQGVLRALDALAVRPNLDRPQSKPSKDSWAFLRIMTGLGIAERPVREEMFNLELLQLWLQSTDLQKLIPDPEAGLMAKKGQKDFMDAIIADKNASNALRKHMAARYAAVTGDAVVSTPDIETIVPKIRPACEPAPEITKPTYRRLRAYAVDPSLANRLDTATINEVTLNVRWEKLEPGPTGEYIRVDDVGPTTNEFYEPVNLEDPNLLAQDGWAPSEGNPQFHQQMVYAVAMRTIERFEVALGRPVLWRPRESRVKTQPPTFVRQLLIRPHAMRQSNAFYSPDEHALKFGYFEAVENSDGNPAFGAYVYSCLSHDIVAHEATHAVLDGMHHQLSEPSNPDVLAFHEAFADIVALMQHMALPELLVTEIARVRGDLEAESLLGSLAIQFGYAIGTRGALRNAIGSRKDGAWKRDEPDVKAMSRTLAPHARGGILVGAVFDAYVAIYKSRVADLLRIATGGTGVLPSGALHPDLVKRLANEAVKASQHVLNMCIRALDYLPPVDLTFFEYLRAIITADSDIVRDDPYNYRIAFVEAFRRRGINPLGVDGDSDTPPRSYSVDTLRWSGFDVRTLTTRNKANIIKKTLSIVKLLQKFAEDCFYINDREELFKTVIAYRASLTKEMNSAIKALPSFGQALGLDAGLRVNVDQVRRCMRIGPDGRHEPQVIVALTQEKQQAANKKSNTPAFTFRSGCTLVVDLSTSTIKYAIMRAAGGKGKDRSAAFVRDTASDPLRGLYFDSERKEPFAILHALADDGTTA